MFSKRFNSEKPIDKRLYELVASGRFSRYVLIDQLNKDTFGLLAAPQLVIMTGQLKLHGANEFTVGGRLTLTAILAPIAAFIWVLPESLCCFPAILVLVIVLLLKSGLRGFVEVYFDAAEVLGDAESTLSII